MTGFHVIAERRLSAFEGSKCDSRLEELDILKGMLVLGMLVYHAASIAAERHPELSGIMARLAFLHTAFVLLSGFLCGWLYARPSHISRARKRLLLRAAKVFGVFCLANVVLAGSGIRSWEAWMKAGGSLAGVLDHFVREMDAGIAAFVVLYYISILLALAALLVGSAWPRWISAIVFVVCLTGSGYSKTLWFLSFGLAGLLTGLWLCGYTKREGRLTTDRSSFVPYILAVYVMLPFIQFRNPVFAFLFTMFETVLWSWSCLWLFGLLSNERIRDCIRELGKDTLFAYVGQMLCLQINWILWARYVESPYACFGANLLLSTGVLVGMLRLVNRWGGEFAPLGTAYRFLFH